MEKIDIVTVVNDFEKYNKYFVKNNKVNSNNLVTFDNTKENQSITKRFNQYITNKMNDDKWIVFCHQDFEFNENINTILNNDLSKDFIYGPVGAGTKKQFAFFLRMDGFKIAKFRTTMIDKQIIKGQILENNGKKVKFTGKRVPDFEIVQTLDCCCFIIHSSLIQKMNFRFDENLNWRLYAEDLCLSAKTKFDIKTKILNIRATHFSPGNFNQEFTNSLSYLKNKYSSIPIVSTCFDGAYEKFLNQL